MHGQTSTALIMDKQMLLTYLRRQVFVFYFSVELCPCFSAKITKIHFEITKSCQGRRRSIPNVVLVESRLITYHNHTIQSYSTNEKSKEFTLVAHHADASSDVSSDYLGFQRYHIFFFFLHSWSQIIMFKPLANSAIYCPEIGNILLLALYT